MNTNPYLTPVQITLVKVTWRKLLPIAEVASNLFYSRLFEMNPRLYDMFGHVYIPEQRNKLAKVVSLVVKSLNELETLGPVLNELGKRHLGYGVEDHHYEQVGDAFLWALEAGLGDYWNDEIKLAWSNVYLLLATTMKEGAQLETASAA